jgi:hypothetical protein
VTLKLLNNKSDANISQTLIRANCCCFCLILGVRNTVEATAVLVDAHCNVCRHYGAKPALLNSMQQKCHNVGDLTPLHIVRNNLCHVFVAHQLRESLQKRLPSTAATTKNRENWCQNFEIDVLVRKGTPRPSRGATCAPGLERLHRLNRLGGQRCAQVLRRSPHVFLLSSCFD